MISRKNGAKKRVFNDATQILREMYKKRFGKK